MGTSGFAESAPSGGRHRHGGWLALVVAIYVVLRVVAVFTVAGNWDEFVLLERALVFAGGEGPVLGRELSA